jgi:hypothetical protein
MRSERGRTWFLDTMVAGLDRISVSLIHPLIIPTDACVPEPNSSWLGDTYGGEPSSFIGAFFSLLI